MSQQPYAQPQFVMMPQPQSNALGSFGFVIALIGLFIPTGIVALLGLILSLAAIGRSPRGLAAMGVVLGLLGTVFWLGVMVVALAVGVIGMVAVAVVIGVGFLLIQPEVVEATTDMVNIAIATEEYQQDAGTLPNGIAELGLSFAVTTDPWGSSYVLIPADGDPGYDIISAGADQEFATDDDVCLSRLDRVWETAVEEYGEKAEELGRKLERIDQSRSGCRITIGSESSEETRDYLAEALRAIEQVDAAEPPEETAEADGETPEVPQ